MPSNVLPLRLKQTFPPIIWIFTEGEGDEVESRLPFKIFSTLPKTKKLSFFSSTNIQFTILEQFLKFEACKSGDLEYVHKQSLQL